MNQLRNISDVGAGEGRGEGLGGVGSPRSLKEVVFPLPMKSEEKIGADRLGDLASLVEFNPESTVVVSHLYPIIHVHCINYTCVHMYMSCTCISVSSI